MKYNPKQQKGLGNKLSGNPNAGAIEGLAKLGLGAGAIYGAIKTLQNGIHSITEDSIILKDSFRAELANALRRKNDN